MSIRAMEPVRPEVRSLEPYVPGKPVEELERELQISGAIKLASNENPLGPSPLAIEAMAEAIRGVNPHPDNPTGTMVSPRALAAYFDRVPEHVLTILHEAYFESVTDPEYPNGLDYLRQGKRVAVLRTFSKVYALAGLRVGYGFFSAELA